MDEAAPGGLPPAAGLDTRIGPGPRNGTPLARGDRLTFELVFDRFGNRSVRYLVLEVIGKDQEHPQMHTTSVLEGGKVSGRITYPYFVSLRLFDGAGHALRSSRVSIDEEVAQGHVSPCVHGQKVHEIQERIVAEEEHGKPRNAWEMQEAFGPLWEATLSSTNSLLALLQLAQGDDRGCPCPCDI